VNHVNTTVRVVGDRDKGDRDSTGDVDMGERDTDDRGMGERQSWMEMLAIVRS